MPKIETAQFVFAAMLAIFIMLTALKKSDRTRARMALACLSAIVLLGLMAACGGGGGGGIVPQTYQITIQGVSGNFQHSTTVQLVVD
jgi:hypothetical protein